MMNNKTTKIISPIGGTKVVVENQVKRDDIVKDGNSTFPVNICVDNHIRNQISALTNLGKAKSQKELVQILIDDSVDKLTDSEHLKYDNILSILEQKENSHKC